MSSDLRISHLILRGFVTQLFQAGGLNARDAERVADCLVWANLRGVDSHGIIRIPFYMQMLRERVANEQPDIAVVNDLPGAMVIDGDAGLGPVVLSFAMQQAIDRATQSAVAWVLVRNTKHTGAVSYYTRMAADAGMAGIYLGASAPNMAYHGASAAGVSTNPIAISMPGAEDRILSLDMATAVVGRGKLMHHRATGMPLEPGWALDDGGRPTTDPLKASIPMPMGGPKGSGLALMFECLTSLFADNPLISSHLTGNALPHQQNALVVALNVAAFTSLDGFRANVEALIDAVKALPLAAGEQRILAPGERGDAAMNARARRGIPVPNKTWASVANEAERMNVPLPDVLFEGEPGA